MNKLEFQQNIGETASCTKRIIMVKKVYGNLLSNNNYFAHIWFSVLKTFEEAIDEVVYYCRPVKTGHKGSFLHM